PPPLTPTLFPYTTLFRSPFRHLPLQVPGKGNDLRNRPVQRLGYLVTQLRAREHARQIGVLVDGHFVLQRQLDYLLGQFAFTLGGDGRGFRATVVEQGNGFSGLAHQVTSSIQRCRAACCGCCGLPPGQLRSPPPSPRVRRRSRSCSSWLSTRLRVLGCSAQNALLTRPLSSRAATCSGPRWFR